MVRQGFRYRFGTMAGRGALVVLAVLAMAGPSIAQSAKIDFTSVKRKACSPLQQQYDQAVAAAAKDPLLAEYQERLVALDAAADAILQELVSYREDFVARTTATVDAGGSDGGKVARRGAAQILVEAQRQFARPLPVPHINPEQQEVLHAYYLACSAALEQCVGKYATDRAMPGASDDDTREIQRLCMVLPLLTSSEDAWSAKDMEALPDSIKTSAAVEVAEEFALRLRRSVTAFALHSFNQDHKFAARPAGNAELVAYLRTGSDIMLRSKDYDAAKYYLSQAVQLAGSPLERGDLQLRLAEVLDDTGDPAAAADALSKVLSETKDDDTYGRAAMLRLKYLYEAKAFKDVLAETPKYQQDSRGEPYLPQILYIAWVASRQQNAGDGASDQWQKTFLDRFPDHSLGAEMRFASAMGLLAESKYDEALKILDYIQYHYPTSKVTPRAKEISQRLRQTMAKTPGTAEAQ